MYKFPLEFRRTFFFCALVSPYNLKGLNSHLLPTPFEFKNADKPHRQQSIICKYNIILRILHIHTYLYTIDSRSFPSFAAVFRTPARHPAPNQKPIAKRFDLQITATPPNYTPIGEWRVTYRNSTAVNRVHSHNDVQVPARQ